MPANEPRVSALSVTPVKGTRLHQVDTIELDATFALVVSRTEGLADECIQPLTFCASSPNSVGAGAEIDWSGSNSIAANDLVLNTTGLPLGQFGYYLMCESRRARPIASGVLCVGSPFYRFNHPGNDLNSVMVGTMQLSVDLTNLPQNQVFLPGSAWYFQLWYRDANTSNFSRSLRFDWN